MESSKLVDHENSGYNSLLGYVSLGFPNSQLKTIMHLKTKIESVACNKLEGCLSSTDLTISI